MTANPLRVAIGSMMADAVAIMAGRKISELPVVDADGKPVGLIDITDVVALLPQGRRRARATAGNRAARNRRAGAVVGEAGQRTQCVAIALHTSLAIPNP